MSGITTSIMFKTSFEHLFRVIFLYLIIRTCTAHGFTESEKEYIDKYIQKTLGCRKIPGLNIALIKDGRIAYIRGYGVKDTETRRPVDPNGNTLFCVASNTKAFTATLIAKLLSEAKGKYPRLWNTPVRDILGDSFKLNNDYLTKQVTLKDILAHKVGLARYDTLWFASSIKKDELVGRLRFAKSWTDFRDSFAYSNVFYGIAARVAEKMAGGKPWDHLIREHFLKPLNMTKTDFLSSQHYHERTDSAKPHITYNNTFKLVDVKALQRAASVGDGAVSLCSTASDMAKWMMFNLGAGRGPNGKQVMDSKWLLETHKPRMSVYLGNNWMAALSLKHWPVSFNLHTYGLGWLMGNYRGHRLIGHSGSLYGFRSWMTLFPEKRAGMFMSYNGDGVLGNLARVSISYLLKDMVLGLKPWLNQNSTCEFPSPWAKQPKVHVERYTINKTITPHRPLADYVGVYHHELFGNLSVSLTELPEDAMVVNSNDTYGNGSNGEENSQSGDGDGSIMALLIVYGRLHILAYPSAKQDIFLGHTTGELWFMWSSDQVSLLGPMKIYFSNSTSSGTIDGIRIPYVETRAHPTFLRNPPQKPLAKAVVSHQGLEKACATQSLAYITSAAKNSSPTFLTLVISFYAILISHIDHAGSIF